MVGPNQTAAPLRTNPPSATAVAATRPLIVIANPSADVYGSDLQLLETVTALVGNGYRVEVTVPADGPLTAELRSRGAEIRYLDYPVVRRANLAPVAFAKLLFAALVAFPRLLNFLRRSRPALVYVNTVTVPWWLLAARLLRVPAACHVHEAENTGSAAIQRALHGPLWFANSVIVNSSLTRDIVTAAFPRLGDRAHTVYNGVPQPLREPGYPRRERPFRAVTVGRLNPRKAQHVALDAIGLLRYRGYDVTIEFAGTCFPGMEWYVEQLELRAAQPDLAGAVTFRGYCSPVWPTIDGADVVVQPSVMESLGNAVIEAQLSRRPVVATAAGGHFESITDGQTGLLVVPDDATAMADAIARVLDDEVLALTIADQGRTSAMNRFAPQRYRAEILAVVDALVPSSPQRARG